MFVRVSCKVSHLLFAWYQVNIVYFLSHLAALFSKLLPSLEHFAA